MPLSRRTLTALLAVLAALAIVPVGIAIASSAGSQAPDRALPRGTTDDPDPPVDPEPPKLTPKPGQAREGDRGKRTLKIGLRLDRQPTEPVTVAYRLKPGTAKARKDYLGRGGKARFRTGQRKATVKVRIKADRKPERKREKFQVVLMRSESVELTKPRTTGTIVDDD